MSMGLLSPCLSHKDKEVKRIERGCGRRGNRNKSNYSGILHCAHLCVRAFNGTLEIVENKERVPERGPVNAMRGAKVP
jgi:hypothetical protein